ncbi:MAG: DUF4112 domain-containing protein [Vicinamibacterales bacterium]
MNIPNLERLRTWQRLLDQAFRVPGTDIRFGWDPIIGLVPWAGDALTALLACAMVVEAHRMRVPRVVQLRMLMNVGLDLLIGVVPLAGDVADVFWQASTRNLALLERHAGGQRRAAAGDWLFVVGVILAIVAIASLPVIVLYWLLHVVLGRPWL